jgi:hypothetical protein
MATGQAQTNVQVDSLLPMAKGWDEQAAAMAKIVSEINSNQLSDATSIVTGYGGQNFSGVGISEDYPLFASAFAVYGQVVTMYGGLCREGSQMMDAIAQALVTSYHNYQTTESANIASVNNIG